MGRKASRLSQELGTRVRGLREERGWTQRELAGYLGIEISRLKKWENGDHEPPLSAIRRLADVLQVEVGYLLGMGNAPPPCSDGELLACFRAVAQSDFERKAVLTIFEILFAHGRYVEARCSRSRADHASS